MIVSTLRKFYLVTNTLAVILSLGIMVIISRYLIIAHSNEAGIFLFGWCFSSTGIYAALKLITQLKKITVTDERIIIRYVFLKKEYTYSIEQLNGYCWRTEYSKYKTYKSFHLETNDNKVYALIEYEYRNFDELTTAITHLSESTFINSSYQWNQKLHLAITAVTAALVLFFLTTITFYLLFV